MEKEKYMKGQASPKGIVYSSSHLDLIGARKHKPKRGDGNVSDITSNPTTQLDL